MVRAKDPSVVFLAETWADEARLKQVQRKIQFENIFSTPRPNRGGGLVMFWRSSIDVSVVGSSMNYIDAIINRNKEGEWRFTGFYGEPETHKRSESWEQLRRLERKFQLPWLCAGDFNELTRADEKLGGNRRSHAQMQLFRDAIDECGFIDLGYSGSKFTWRKHFANGQSIWERLDRALCTNDWLQQFGATKVFHLKSSTSDHIPIWIVPNGLDPPPLSRPFRFEEMWLSDKGCGRTVEAVWRDDFNCEAEVQVIRKIEKCGKDLTQWSRQHFGSVRRKLKEKKKQLEKAELVAMHSGNNFQVRELTKESGIYSVKSGYYFLKSEIRTATQAQAITDQPKPPWNRIWKLSLPNKIKNFLWRAVHNALPTNSELTRRCIINDPICSFCSSQGEDVLHALWSCPSLSQVWDGDPQWSFRQTSRYSDFAQLLSSVLDAACNVELLATIMWTIWFRRNKTRFAPPGLPLDQIMQTAIDSFLEFQKAQTPAEPRIARPRTRWFAPPNESFKINFDGAVFKDKDRAGIGVIIRDSRGLVMGSMSQVVPLPQTIVELEALAALKALEFAADLGLFNVILEGDSEILINALMDNSLSLASFGLLIQDIKAYAEFFQCISFSHIRREGNIVAHNLARHACHVTGFPVWMEDVPYHTLAAYQADLHTDE
ncbi:hypothetical protein SO802_012321 [Lithocarpus litseifolius]|uniref:Reverse transcriptase n=1 Tax=Lithocarpus litseifolius TaxID=425828 RepID=A0AAW2D5Y7_9ROSI